MNRIHRCLGVVAALGGVLLTLAVAAPAALGTIPEPGGEPTPGTGPVMPHRCHRRHARLADHPDRGWRRIGRRRRCGAPGPGLGGTAERCRAGWLTWECTVHALPE